MFKKWLKYSYAAQKDQRHQARWIVVWLAAFFIVYTLLTSFLFSMRVLKNETMQPGFHSGDRLILSSNKLYSLFSTQDWTGKEFPFRRGSVVLVDMSLAENRSLINRVSDTLTRFFTFQQVRLYNREERFYIKRVIGLPGDEISMTNYVLRIKPAGEPYSFTEFELVEKPYNVTIPQVPALWDESLPFSGTMERRVLKDTECFVLSDDRSNTNESRSFGPVPAALIEGRVLFRYWPFTRLGRP
jgi:signal peptidase I